jgi:hypothetical protein
VIFPYTQLLRRKLGSPVMYPNDWPIFFPYLNVKGRLEPNTSRCCLWIECLAALRSRAGKQL